MAKKYWSRASNHDSSKPQKTHSVARKVAQKLDERSKLKNQENGFSKDIDSLKAFHQLKVNGNFFHIVAHKIS